MACLFAGLVFAGCTGPVTGHIEDGSDAGLEPTEGNTLPPKPENATRQHISSGHIVAGGAHTRHFRSLAVLGQPGIDAFFFPAPGPGTNVTTVTTSGGLPYDLDINFHDASGLWLGGCQTAKPDEVCRVPNRATRGEVAAYAGANLDVQVFTAPESSAPSARRSR